MIGKQQNPRKAAYEILKKIDRDASYSNLELSARLRTAELDARDAGLICALVYGVLERKITLDYILNRHLSKPVEKARFDVRTILRMGAFQIVFLDRVPVSAAVNESVKLAKESGCAFAAGMINAVLRKVVQDDGGWRTQRDSVRWSCPQALIDHFTGAYGEEAAQGILAASFGGNDTYLRVNSLRSDAARLQKRLSEEGIGAQVSSRVENALVVTRSGALDRLAAYREGLFHVQGLPSQLCVRLLDVRPGMRTADVCAAPGGKSFTMAQQMENRGEVWSFDLHPHRVELIDRGARRLGISIIRAQVRDAAREAETRMRFDRVLCDVPCSGLGDLSSKPELRYKEAYTVPDLVALQQQILEQSARLLRPGGRLVYSTCTLNPRENEEVCRRFLKQHRDFHLIGGEIPGTLCRDGGMWTFLPQDFGGNGFFAAAVEREG